MQAPDGIQRGQQCALLPGRHARGMFTREHDAAVDRTQIVVMLGAQFLGPVPGAPQSPGHAMPGDRDAVLEFGRILRMNLRSPLDRLADAFFGGHRRDLEGIGPEGVGTEQHARTFVEIACARIADQRVGQIGEGDAAVDRLILFPEAALELQSDFDRRVVEQCIDGIFHRCAHL